MVEARLDEGGQAPIRGEQDEDRHGESVDRGLSTATQRDRGDPPVSVRPQSPDVVFSFPQLSRGACTIPCACRYRSRRRDRPSHARDSSGDREFARAPARSRFVEHASSSSPPYGVTLVPDSRCLRTRESRTTTYASLRAWFSSRIFGRWRVRRTMHVGSSAQQSAFY